MTKRKKPEDKKSKCPADEGKSGYWEPDLDLQAILESIEIDEPDFPSTGRPRYWTEERALQVGKKLIEWAMQPEAINKAGYLAKVGLTSDQAWKLSRKYPRFDICYKKAQALVGRNREMRAGKGFDAGLAKKFAGVYDKEYEAWELKIRDLDAKANSKEITVNVRGKMKEPDLDNEQDLELEEDKSHKFQAVKRKLKDKGEAKGD